MNNQSVSVLITGGCGYLGSQLLHDLATHSQGNVRLIRVLDNLHSGEIRALQELPVGPVYEFLEGDILDPVMLDLAVNEIDIVVHLAALVGTPLSFENPAWLQQVNQWGTSHLVEACLNGGVSHLVFASSTAVYGPGGPFDESDQCRPQGGYAKSKLAAEETLTMARQRGLRASILRFGSLFGLAPVTRFDAVANRLAYLAGVRRTVSIYGSGEQRRPFVHVRDAASAIISSLHDPRWANEHAINVVSDTLSVNELVNILQIVQPELTLRYTDQDVRTRFSFDIRNKYLHKLGWTPVVSVQEGLREVVSSLRGFRHHHIVHSDLEMG